MDIVQYMQVAPLSEWFAADEAGVDLAGQPKGEGAGSRCMQCHRV
jgi:hypothetical protein